MIKVKDGYGKLIGTTYLGVSDKVLLSNGGDFGLHTGRNNEANKIVRTDADGYILAGWINTTSGDRGNIAINKIYCSNDGYIRYKTPANFFESFDNSGNLVSLTIGSYNRKLTVNYATIANYIQGGFSATYTNKWDCNNPDRVVYSDYGSPGRNITNAPSNWYYGTLLELGHINQRGLNSPLNLLLMWDVAHNTTKAGTLWFRGKDDVNGWNKNWAKVITDLNIQEYGFWQGTKYWANIPVSNSSSVSTQPTFYNTRILGKNASLFIQNTASENESFSIIRIGNHLRENAAEIFLNSPTRTNDGGNNMMTIRNNVGNLRLDNNVSVTSSLDTPKLRIIGTTENPSWNSNGAITWAENTNNSQAVSLVYTSYDSYRAPAGLKLIGNLGNEWLEAPRFIKSGSNDNYILLGGGGHKSTFDFYITNLIGTKNDYEYVIILLFKDAEINNHRINGKIYSTAGGGRRYCCTDLDCWFSRWANNGHDHSFYVMNHGQHKLDLVTCTYQGAKWWGLKHTNIHAENFYFVGTASNTSFTIIKYFKTNTNQVLNSEINNSIQDLGNMVGRMYNGNYTIAYTQDLKNPVDYYWANVKVSNQSSTSTSPTFANVIATSRLTTPLINATRVLTLSGTSGIYLKYNNDDTKSLVLNNTLFKPFDASNGKLDLGSSSARWKVFYANVGRFYESLTVHNDGILKIYTESGGGCPDCGKEAVIMQTSFNSDDPLVSGYPTTHQSRCVLSLLPRGGFVGIGTKTPNEKLSVAGNINATKFMKTGSSDSYVLLGGGGHKALSELSSSNHNHDNIYWKVNGLTTKGTGDIYLEMWRGVNSSWKILNSSGNLYFQNNYVNSAGSYFSVLTLNYNTGYAIFKGDITCNQFHRTAKSEQWVNGRRGALLRETSSTGYHALWSLKTTNGSWDFGEYNFSGWLNIPVLSYITDANYNSGNNSTTYQIKFPLASGTVALTNLLPTVARYNTTLSTSYIKIKINSTEAWMLGFNVRVYQGYKYYDIRFSGYNYGSNHWYSPKASLVEGDDSIKVYFGYDSTWNLWVGLLGGSYTGVEISNVTNGYNPHNKGELLGTLFAISNVSSLTTIQAELTLSPPAKKTDLTWGNITGKPSIPTVTNYYWANIKVSSSPLTNTSPTFANVYGNNGFFNWVGANTNKSFSIGANNGYAIYIPTNNNVGIGVSSPSDKLQVAGLLRLDSSNVHLRLGPQNSSYAHYSTNASIGHWFNTNVEVLGVCRPYVNNKYSSGDSVNRWSNVYSYAGDFKGLVTITYNNYPGLTVHNNTTSGESSIYIKNNTAGWALGVNPWSVGAGEFAIGQYSGSGSSKWRFRINNTGYCYTSSYLNLGAGNEKNTSSPPYVWGVNGSDNFLRTYNTSSLRVGYANDSDKLDGYHRQGLYSSIPEWISANRYTKSIVINGDSSTYYPVVIDAPISKEFPGFISVWKNLGSQTASYQGNHSNGTASMWLLYEGRKTIWDGNGGYFKCLYRSMPYSNLCAKAEAGSSGSGRLIVYLRGGGTQYYISTTYGVTADVYMSHTNIESSQYPVYVTPTSTLGNLGIFNTTYVGYGSITGSSASVRDVGDGLPTTFAYGKPTMAYGDFTYLAAWNSYELRAVNKNIFAASSHSHAYLPLSGGQMNTNAKITCNTSSTNTNYGGAIEIREYNYVTSNLSSWAYAPGITFHWGNRAVGKLGLRSDGLIAYKDVPLSLNTHNHNSSYVTSLGTNGNYLTWTKNGTTNNITVPYASSAGYTTRLYANSTSNLTTAPGEYSLSYARFLAGASNSFPTSNNANGVITVHTHSGNYYAQIGLSSNGRMYHRFMTAQSLSAGVSWNTVAWLSDLTWNNISGKPTIPSISNLVTLNTELTITANKTFNSTITFAANNSYGIFPAANNYCKIGTSDKAFYRFYVNGILPGSSSIASSVIGSASTPFKNAFLDKITSKVVLLKALTRSYSDLAYVEYEIYQFSHIVVVSGLITTHQGTSRTQEILLTSELPIPVGSYQHAGIFYSKGGGSELRQVNLFVNSDGLLRIVWQAANHIDLKPFSFAYLTNDLSKL